MLALKQNITRKAETPPVSEAEVRVQACLAELRAHQHSYFKARRILAEQDEYCRWKTERYRFLALSLVVVIVTIVLVGFGLSYFLMAAKGRL